MTDKKITTIYVKGRKYEIQDEKIGYEEVLNLGCPDRKQGPDFEYDVTWKDGPKDRPEGVLKEEEYVEVVEEMKFDVKFTDKS